MIIGIAGSKQVGKSLSSKYLNSTSGGIFHEILFADKLKEIVCLLTSCRRSDLEDGDFKSSSFPMLIHERTGTYREALQVIGTDLFRNRFNQDVWVLSTLQGIVNDTIIADVRFPNEVDAIKKAGGIVINIERETGLTDSHPSEHALDGYGGFDYEIDNNGTKEELYDKLYEIWKQINAQF